MNRRTELLTVNAARLDGIKSSSNIIVEFLANKNLKVLRVGKLKKIKKPNFVYELEDGNGHVYPVLIREVPERGEMKLDYDIFNYITKCFMWDTEHNCVYIIDKSIFTTGGKKAGLNIANVTSNNIYCPSPTQILNSKPEPAPDLKEVAEEQVNRIYHNLCNALGTRLIPSFDGANIKFIE